MLSIEQRTEYKHSICSLIKISEIHSKVKCILFHANKDVRQQHDIEV